jgi:cation diffusion facilitator CzcD-associated flavoprotein CzcO
MNGSPALRLHPASASPAAGTDVGVAILGAGFAGICMAIKLLEAGHDDLVVFEKASDLGGTWRDNTYPGCGCDVPAHLYSYSFAQDPGWTRKYPRQPEILAYIRRVADRHDVTRRIVFDTAIQSLTWDERARRWRILARDGRRFTARVVVSAVGALHEPKIPDLPGLASFAGPAFHSARWRHDVDLAGRRVAVIGTGASAVQIIPEIAPLVAGLTVFQRSPPWVLPRRDRSVPRLVRRLLAGVPGLLRGWRAVQYLGAERIAIGLAYKPKLMGTGQRESARYKEREISDPGLRLKLNPFYTLGCKRILLSDDFYATMARPHVDLVTDPIREVRPRAIVTADGREHPCDVLIHATGFQAFDHSARMTVRGREGRLLADEWRDGPQAFHGVAVAGFPNYFLLMGPNTGLGHNSIVFMIEQQVKYVMQCLRWLDEGRLETVEVRPEVQRDYNDRLQERFKQTVWRDTSNGSVWQLPCSSWYVNATGRNTALWPGPSLTYWLTMRRADITNYLPTTEAAPALPDAGSLPERRAA